MTHTLRAKPLVATLLSLLAILVMASCSPEQQTALDLINETRTEAGLPTVRAHLALMNKAQAWAEQLASENGLRHSNLPDGVTGSWLRIGENVGRGPSIEAIHEAYLASSGHRANILDSTFNFAGTGYAVGADGTVYTVQVFARY